MELYFLRHARAMKREEWTGPDARRPLTEKGAALMRREAAALARLDLRLDLIVTSPLERARHTAEIAAKALGLKRRVIRSTALAPGFSVQKLARFLASHPKVSRVMFVGHEPDFSQVLSELTGGGRVICRKGCLARIDVTGTTFRKGSGRLIWLLQPEVLAK